MRARTSLVGALLLVACSRNPAPAEAPEPLAASATTRLARVSPASSLGWLEAPARALPAPDATAVVGTPLPARVLTVRVRPGDRVERDAPLVDVMMPELIGAVGALTAADLRLEAFEQRRKRVAPLSQDGLIRGADLAELEAQIALAKADRARARASLRAAGLRDERAKTLLSGSGALPLRAPIAGVVVAVHTKPGEMREPASGPLLEIASDAPTLIEARFYMPPPPGATLEWIAPNGNNVELVLQGMSPAALQEDGTRVAWLRAKSPAQSPVAHALGRVRVVAPASWSVIPERALLYRDGHAFVAVPDGTGRKHKPVVVVSQTPDQIAVTGLEVGESVFTAEQPVPEGPK